MRLSKILKIVGILVMLLTITSGVLTYFISRKQEVKEEKFGYSAWSRSSTRPTAVMNSRFDARP